MTSESSAYAERIDLAHCADFAIGALRVRPAVREVSRADGTSEVVEPRVMQVLVALARADGAVISRDDLTQACWDGRVVGEDAINRVISRLRRLAEGIGADGFRVETVTKVGYRLVFAQGPAAIVVPAGDDQVVRHPAARPRATRRAVIAGALGVAAAAGGGAWLWYAHDRQPAVPADALAMMQQGDMAMRQANPESNAEAIGLFRRVTELHPDLADGWGILALAYASTSHGRSTHAAEDAKSRGRSAATRALSINPGNAYAQVALAALQPHGGRWWRTEQTIRTARAQHPDNDVLAFQLAMILSDVGRDGEAARLMDRLVVSGPPTPGFGFFHVVMLWTANRLDEADAAMDDAFKLFPIHTGVWFTRFYFLMYTGRAAQAVAMGEASDARPPGIPQDSFTRVIANARAIATRAPQDIERAVTASIAAAHRAAGEAENAIAFTSAVGRIDAAFAIADAYFFGRGFQIGEMRFSEEQRTYTRPDDRRTHFLFEPPCAAMRADPRFAALVGEVGLERYWRQSGTRPDYRGRR